MSRKSIAEYIAEKRRAYSTSGPAKRTRLLNDVCETLGYTRKYVIKLMTGNISQKNGSVVRELFGELRLDCLDLEADLMRLEAEWSDYCNFFRPTKMLVSKSKKPDGKGFVRKYQSGGPKTPYQRVLESSILSEDETKALTGRYKRLNGVQLYQQIVRRLKRILRRQDGWREQQRQTQKLIQEARLADSALRAAPTGTSASPGLLDGTIDLRPDRPSNRQRKIKSVQYLTNQKARRQLQGAHPT